MANPESLMRKLLPPSLALLLASPATAQDAAPPTCAADVPPAGELSSWSQPGTLAAVRDTNHIDQAGIEVGKAAILTLLPARRVAYPVRPARRGRLATFGGLIQFDVAQPGTYRIGLASPAWIDVVKEGKAYAASGHDHGPACSGIRKVVNFELTPGRYTVQISGNPAVQTKVLLARLPETPQPR